MPWTKALAQPNLSGSLLGAQPSGWGSAHAQHASISVCPLDQQRDQ